MVAQVGGCYEIAEGGLLRSSAPGAHHGHEKATPESGDFEPSYWCERGDSNPHLPRQTRSDVMWCFLGEVEGKCQMSVQWFRRAMHFRQTLLSLSDIDAQSLWNSPQATVEKPCDDT